MADDKSEELIGLLEGAGTPDPLATQSTPQLDKIAEIPKVELSQPVLTNNQIEENKPKTTILSEEIKADIGIKKLLEKFLTLADTISNNYDTDRAKVETAINYFEEEVKTARAEGLKLPPTLVEGWVKLLSIKAEINMNATSLTDSVAKLLAAAKNNNVILNITDTGAKGINLVELLDQPRKEDETS